MPHPLPAITELRRLLTYDPETGVLRWLARTPDMFAGSTEQARRKTCACWNGRFAGKPALIGMDGFGYHQGTINGRYLKAHRVAWALHYGKWPSQKCSHRNSDHRDNRIANLRDVDHQTCHRNAKLSKRNTSGAAGVIWNRRMQRWQAFIATENRDAWAPFRPSTPPLPHERPPRSSRAITRTMESRAKRQIASFLAATECDFKLTARSKPDPHEKNAVSMRMPI